MAEMKAIRLTGGLDRCAGILEVHRNGSWGTVCDNCWNKQLASMVCSMLQCGAEPLKYTQFDPPLKHNNGTLYYYHCDAKAQSLWQCGEYTIPHLCKDSKASGVICNGSLGFSVLGTENVNDLSVSTVSTPAPPPPAAAAVISPSPELLSTIALALLLFVFVITSIVLCCLYRRCHAANPRRLSSKRHPNHHDSAADLVKVTTLSVQADVPPSPGHLWTQLRSVDGAAVDGDDPSALSPPPQNSQQDRTDIKPLISLPRVDTLREEDPEPGQSFVGNGAFESDQQQNQEVSSAEDDKHVCSSVITE